MKATADIHLFCYNLYSTFYIPLHFFMQYEWNHIFNHIYQR